MSTGSPAEGAFTGAGGLTLATRAWELRDSAPPRGVVVLVHGLGEHCGRYDRLADALGAAGYAVWSHDHRGHGRSQGPRALIRTEPAVSDLDARVRQAAAAHPGVPVVMLGHSLGGMLAVAHARRFGDRLSGLVLSGPLAALDAPDWQRSLMAGLARVAPRAPVLALDPALVSRDPAVVAAYRADPLVHHGRIPAATLASMLATTASFPGTVDAISLPTLIVYGTADGLCPPRGARMLGERIAAGRADRDVTVRAYDGLYHEVFHEPERERVVGDVIRWLRERC